MKDIFDFEVNLRVDGMYVPNDTRKFYLDRINSYKFDDKPLECNDAYCDIRGPGFCRCGARHYSMTYEEIAEIKIARANASV